MPGTGPLRRSSAPGRIRRLCVSRVLRRRLNEAQKVFFFRSMLLITRCGVGSALLSMGKANRIGSGRLKKANQKLTPEDLEFSDLDGL